MDIINKTLEHEILLIGNPSAALAGFKNSDKLPVMLCEKMPEAIEAAAKNQYNVIAVVMSDIEQNARGHLMTLRKNTNAKILLFARMHEEPKAIELIGHTVNGRRLADDYLICPVELRKFHEVIHGSSIKTVDARTRIKLLEKLAIEDDLTGLKNRRYVREFAKQIIDRTRGNGGRVTVLIFDIDDFKHYNDVYGHAAGDEVLKQAAVLIKRCCRSHDVVARLGGDEFAVVFWDDPKCFTPSAGNERRTYTADHPKEVISIAKRFRRVLEKTDIRFPAANGKTVLTISGGLAALSRDGLTTDELFERADQALLDAKRSGKNRIYLVGQPENDIDKIN